MLALALVAALAGADQFQLPANIVVNRRVVALVTEALRVSPTFREQCARIGAIRRLRVSIELDASDRPPTLFLTRAHTDIRRYQFGAIVAAIHLWSPRDAAELIAHELEHVREFAEGVDYRAQAARTPRSVWMTGPNVFETARALLVGRAVADEVTTRLTARRVDR